ncbi:MAG TPA: M23 family metallopeptidase [Clostridiales bacterium]|nr:M23 family metallopeptidase [Clostridiales bacterium]
MKFYKAKKTKMSPYSAKSYQNPWGRKKSFYYKIMKQIAFCIVIVLLVILIKHLNLPLTNKASQWIKTSLEKEMDIKKTATEIVQFAKKVPELSEKAIHVFSNSNEKKGSKVDFIPPIASGNIVSNYGENIDPISNRKTFQRGIDILVEKRYYIQAIKDGQIVEIQESNNLGKYIKVEHDNNTFSIYGNCSEILVKKGQQVKQGERIALVYPDAAGQVSHFHFELWKDGKIVDPMHYIQFDKREL